jgi:hypothetical protein
MAAHVHNNGHFVLLTSWNDSLNQFNVNDPFYPSTVRAAADTYALNVERSYRPILL